MQKSSNSCISRAWTA